MSRLWWFTNDTSQISLARKYKMKDKLIYLDNAATTPLAPEVLEAMMPYLTTEFMNPSALYDGARKVRASIDNARAQVAHAVGCLPQHVFFTSGATEANNWFLQGVANEFLTQRPASRCELLCSEIEHKSVINTYAMLKTRGFNVHFLRPNHQGYLSAEDIRECLTDDTKLLSVMGANNEIGTLEPITDISDLCHEHNIVYHCDVTQMIGAIPVNMNQQGLYAITFSAHKFHGPKGVGALCIQGDMPPRWMEGGGQEFGMRPGTENVAGIVGMGKAIELAITDMDARSRRIQFRRDYLIGKLMYSFDAATYGDHFVRINGFFSGDERLPNNVNFSLRNMNAETILLMLGMGGICASAGSACDGQNTAISHVLSAIRVPDEYAHGTIRMTLGEDTTKEDIDEVVERLQSSCKMLLGMRNE